MDYDENDFQGQNLHLAGEGCSKVSPVLLPYAISNFDFDDSLQGHLRFDSLVENEVFLGITGQEDNQWIEEYSCGSSGMEFSSSAAESRRNNVWSEATSSESVEMLLKSVRQEEKVVGETIIEQLNNCDEPGSLTKIMDPNLNQDDGKDHVALTQNASVLNEFSGNFSGFSVSSEYEQSQVRFTSQSQVAQISGGELDSIVTSEKCSLSVFEEKVDGECDDVNQKEAENLANESMAKELREDPSVSKVVLGNVGPSENVDASIEEPKVRENLQQVSVNVSGLSKNFSNNVAELSINCKESRMDDPKDSGTMIVESCSYSVEKSLCVLSNEESVYEALVGVGIPVNEEPASLSPTRSSTLQIAEECNNPVCSSEPSQGSKCAVTASLICSEVNKELKNNMHDESHAVFPNVGNIKPQAVQDGNIKSQILDSPESNVGSLSKISHMQNYSVEETYNALGTDSHQVTSDASMVSAGNLPEMGDRSSINLVGTSLTAACLSAELLAEKVSNEEAITSNTAPEVHGGNSNDEDLSLPAKLSGSMRVDCEIRSSDPGAIRTDQDVSFNERRDASFPSECGDMGIEVVGALDSQKNVESSSSAEGSKGNIVIAHNSESNTSVRIEPGSDRSSCPDTSDGVYVPSGGVATADLVTDDQPKSPILGLSLLHQDNKEKAVGFPSEGSPQNETPQVESVVDCVSDDPPSLVEKDASPGPAEKVVHSGHCAPLVENCDASSSEQAAEANIGGKECFKTLEMNPLPSDSSVKRGDNALSVAVMESDRNSSPDPSDGVRVLSGSVATADIFTDDQPKSPIHGVSLLHQDNEKVVGFTSEGSSHNETPQIESVVDCVSEGPSSIVGKDACPDRAEKVVHAGHCGPPVENCSTSTSEQASEANTGGQEFFKTLEMSPLPCDSSVKRGVNAEAGLLDNKESLKERNLAVVPLNIAGTSSVEPSQSSKDKQEVAKGTIDAVEVNIQPVTSSSATEEEKNFTFEIRTSTSHGQAGKGRRSYPTFQDCDLSRILEGSSIISGSSQADAGKSPEVSLPSPQNPGGTTSQVGAKGNSERKTRRKSVVKESAKKGNPQKETTPVRQSGRVENSTLSLTTPASGQVIQFEEVKPNESVKHSVTKPTGILPVLSSKLPDLKNSTSMFQQPFTDNQQVQLRAQILVYGSLISGTPPEEPHMIAAFGQSDSERKAWEGAWRDCLERLHVQKAQANPDTPMQSRSDLKDVGNRAPDQGIKHASLQSKVLSSPIGGASNKCTPSPVVSPMIPLSSPLWNIATPCDVLQSSGMPRSALLDYHQALSPLHPYQTPPVQSFSAHNPSWFSQGPFAGQWVASSPISAYNVGARFPALPVTEAVKLTSVKDSGVPGIKNTSSIPMVYSTGPSVFPGVSSVSDVKKATASSGQPSSDSKSRKRKKVNASVAVKKISVPSLSQVASVSAPVLMHLPQVPRTEGHSQISLLTQNQTDSVCATVVSSPFSTSVAVTTPASMTSKSSPAKFLSVVSPSSTHDHARSGDQNAEVTISEESLSKVEEAKLQAEDAAAHAAAAVSHCQGVWSQLERQKNSGLVSDDEAKLVSAAVSIAAAASVAKVAAAAAKIASNVAEQARSMADEVFVSNNSEFFYQSSMISLATVVNKFDKATPASFLKGGDRGNHSNSVISAAREAARRRLEAASAASKHAENLDAIVKAAELAAEAVAQAGKIVGMGDPLPLSDLVEAGPEGYWKTPRSASKQQAVVAGSLTGNSNKKNVEGTSNMSAKETQAVKPNLSLQENSGVLVNGISVSLISHENDGRRPKAHKSPDLPKTIGVISESEIGSIRTSFGQNMPKSTSGTSKENSIREGCLVEVYKDDDKYKGAWFGANVLSLKDGKAFVCYTEIQSDEGSGQLKEWVPLEVEGSEAPRIRIAHPVTTMRFEGTRKRRRTAVTDFAWSIGDRVDVWIQNCWREGVVTETNKVDATSLTVRFLAQGETSVVRSWYVRPTLVWKDGEWIECCTSEMGRSSQGDAQQEKRQKLGSLVVEVKGNDESSKNVGLVESGKHDESRKLPLSTQESLFNVGKSTRDESKLDPHRTIRSGLQKEGPRVIFGVPKPGKKQKFMDVSKHYVADGSNKNNTAHESVKFARYLMPQAPGPRRWRNHSRRDAKEKQASETNSRALKSRKPPIPSSRTLAQKDSNLTSFKSTTREGAVVNKTARDSLSDDENQSGHQNQTEFGSSSNVDNATAGPDLASLRALPADPPKNDFTSNVKSERPNKRKFAPAGGKAAKVEVKDKSIPELVEPRRSNRRIQPTSRLLEGLQSSLTISKIPAASHSSQRSHSKVTTKAGNTNHG